MHGCLHYWVSVDVSLWISQGKEMWVFYYTICAVVKVVIIWVTLLCIDDTHKHVSLVRTNVSFTCISNISGVRASGFILDKMHQVGLNPEADELYKNRNITWQYTTREGVETWHLSILASVENNGTTVQCIFTSRTSDGDELIVVECWKFYLQKYVVVIMSPGPPSPPGAPTLTVTNLTTLTLTWTAPWPYSGDWGGQQRTQSKYHWRISKGWD